MRPVTILPDAEAAVIAYLSPLLEGSSYAGISISNSGSGSRFIRIRSIGGSPLSPAHDRPLIDALIWHEGGDLARMALARQLHAWLRAACGDPAGDALLYYSGTALGPRQMPDPADDTKRIAMLTVEMISSPL